MEDQRSTRIRVTALLIVGMKFLDPIQSGAVVPHSKTLAREPEHSMVAERTLSFTSLAEADCLSSPAYEFADV